MRIELAEGVTLSNVGGAAVLMDAMGNAAVLNDTASSVLSALLDHGDDAEVALLEEYDADSGQLSSELARVVRELEDCGMVWSL